MSLSRWVNQENARENNGWPPYTEVGIGLAIDGSRALPTYSHLLIPINERNVLRSFEQPADEWTPFPSKPLIPS